MGVEPNPDADLPARIPPRDAATEASGAEARMLARIVGARIEPAPPATATIGEYRLLDRLGRGGMGDVWEARDAADKPVAIKVLRAAVAAHEPTRKRFEREARTAATVVHPRIVRILGVGHTEAGEPYIVMERLAGTPLEALVRTHGALPWTSAREILKQICEGLQCAHHHGVIHRDLKPANVMVEGGVDAPQCTIIDFGLARREVVSSGSEALSRTGEVFGSPPFMSPEQFRGDDVDARADIYSFGCLMYFVLTGERPFAGEKIGELMYRHLFAPPPVPTGMRCPQRIAPALASIVLRAMCKDQGHRFADMAEIIAALERIERDPTPVHVPDETVIGPLAKAAIVTGTQRRRWAWTAIGGLSFTVVAVGALWIGSSNSPPPASAPSPPAGTPDDVAARTPESLVSAATPAPMQPPTAAAPPSPQPSEAASPAGPTHPPTRSAGPRATAKARTLRPRSAAPASPTAEPQPTPIAPPNHPQAPSAAPPVHPRTPPVASELPPNPFRSPVHGAGDR